MRRTKGHGSIESINFNFTVEKNTKMVWIFFFLVAGKLVKKKKNTKMVHGHDGVSVCCVWMGTVQFIVLVGFSLLAVRIPISLTWKFSHVNTREFLYERI